jgi:Tetratricopeptide repeat
VGAFSPVAYGDVGGQTDSSSTGARWQKRITYVTKGTARQAFGNLLIAERLAGVRVSCPRCHREGQAAIWRRFDYYGPKVPLYFTKCAGCHHRTLVKRTEAAELLQGAGLDQTDGILTGGDADQVGALDATSANDAPELSLEAAKQLVVNRQRALGAKHLNTFEARSELAAATGKNGDEAGALQLFQDLLADEQHALGPEHPVTLDTRYHVAVWTAKTGSPIEAVHLGGSLLQDQQRVLGPDHPYTLRTRASIATWNQAAGGITEAVRQLKELLPDQERVLGPDHPDTISTRQLLANWGGGR